VIADRTRAFHFSRPAGFTFKAGQAIDVLLDGAGGATESTRHTFSIASAPFEDRLTVATRMRESDFKRALAALPVGANLRLEGPSGSLTLHSDASRPAIFIAGGIGVTPFMSILRQAARDRPARRLVLLYSNHRPEDAAWLHELKSLERGWTDFRLLPVMTAMNRSSESWSGLAGRIDADMLRNVGVDLPSPVYYVAGAPGMVAAMRAVLNDTRIEDDDIRSEDFHGY
jgi:ferredoxin-NADP reductase